MSGATALERGYRRLLAWYPTWHQQAHGEEMIGVLMAAAPGSRRRPSLGETLNIIWAGLLIRLRPRPTALPTGAWPDALAAFSVAAPVAFACMAVAWELDRGVTSPVSAALAVLYYGLGLPLPLVLLRLRRVAAVVSLLATVFLAVVSANLIYHGALGQPFALSLFAYAAETVALFGSAGPRRGLQCLTWRTWVLTAVAGACSGVAWYSLELGTVWATSWPGAPRLDEAQLAGMLVAGVVAVVVGGAIAAWVASRSAFGRRVLVLFAIPLYVLLVTSTAYLFGRPATLALLTYLPPLAAAGFALLAARKSRRPGPDGEPA
jgi:hypothetical protein